MAGFACHSENFQNKNKVFILEIVLDNFLKSQKTIDKPTAK
jgi:hypothetical protein